MFSFALAALALAHASTGALAITSADFDCEPGQVKAIVDFEGFAAGDAVTEVCFTKGITADEEVMQEYDTEFCIPVVGGPPQAGGLPTNTKFPMIFDTANPTGGDNDLATTTEGNVLILSEDGDASDPDDNGGGAIFTFNFTGNAAFQAAFASVDVEAACLLDIEETGTIEIIRAGNMNPAMIDFPNAGGGGNNVLFSVDVSGDGSNVEFLKFKLAGSGAVSSFGMCLTKNELCETGIRDGVTGLICCSGECERCGGCSCGDVTNKVTGTWSDAGEAAAACCPGSIVESGIFCLDAFSDSCIACCPGEPCVVPPNPGTSCD